MINLAHAVLHDVTSFTLLLLEVWFGDQNAFFQLRVETTACPTIFVPISLQVKNYGLLVIKVTIFLKEICPRKHEKTALESVARNRFNFFHYC